MQGAKPADYNFSFRLKARQFGYIDSRERVCLTQKNAKPIMREQGLNKMEALTNVAFAEAR
jgi:hypothetical protein